jgi:hypothetical protein
LTNRFWKVTFNLTKIIEALEIKLVDLFNPFVTVKRAQKRLLNVFLESVNDEYETWSYECVNRACKVIY